MAAVELLSAGRGAARDPAAPDRDVRSRGLARVRRAPAQLGQSPVSVTGTNDRPISDGAGQTDFLVVGAGAGGCAAARALVDGTDARVTLLESGGTNQRDEVRDPTRGRSVRFSDAGGRSLTVPQRGTNGRVHEWPMGRLVGGSTSLNGMIWTRGAQWDYDGWAAMGNPGWDARTVYDAFRALEDFEQGNPVDHGVGGPVKVT